MLESLRNHLRPVYLRTVHRALCWLRGDLPRDGERVDPRKPSPLLDAHRAIYFFARGFLPEGGRVLDLGCGAGYAAEILTEVPGSTYLGVDGDSLALHYARTRYGSPRAGFQNLDLEPERLGSRLAGLGPADLVVSSNCLEHLRGGLELPSLVAPLLRPGGAFVMAVPPSDGTPDENPFHFCEHPATRWQEVLGACFPRVRCFAHRGWGTPAEDQEFPEVPASELHSEATITALLVGEAG